MAYDEDLADRIRELVGEEPRLYEQKMFGGLAFLVGGHLAVGAGGHGGILVRVDPEKYESLLARSNAQPMEMRGKPMRGWLQVDAEHVKTKRQLWRWVERGLDHARALPPKR